MSTHLYLAPAAAGKTAFVLDLARTTAQGLAGEARVVVASHLQVRAARRRLAEMGGAIGVRVLTFDRLYAEILSAAAETYVELSEPVQYRLLRSLLGSPLPLRHYAPIAGRPGFIQVLQRLIGELKAAGVHPDHFAAAVRTLGSEPRLAELALIYSAYQSRLGAQDWADRAGLGWLAVEALRERAPSVARDWLLLAVDGFDDFTPVQAALLHETAGRAGHLIITLTGEPEGEHLSLVHQRLSETRKTLEAALGVQAEPLPPLNLGGLDSPPRSSTLVRLERQLFRPTQSPPDLTGLGGPVRSPHVEMIEAADRVGEVRAALRWLKARILLDGYHPNQVALLARNVTHYRPFILQTAAEFAMPVRLAGGLPLRENPAVAALLDLMEIMVPAGDGEPALPRRPVIEAWRSPYFDWAALDAGDRSDPAGIAPDSADDLNATARWGRVIGGRKQWEEALDHLAEIGNQPSDPIASARQDEDRGVPIGLPRGDAARALAARFDRFVERLTPPAGRRSYREFACWVEDLIGADPSAASPLPEEEQASLQVVTRACQGDAPLVERDISALVALKDVLRGLVWAEDALGTAPVEYATFCAEFTGAVDAASFTLPTPPDREEILVADVVQARGLPFRAVAVLGLAEGEFPATLSEDPFLRDADRQRLRDECGLPLEPSTRSAEAEYFYEAAARPSERLLLTRPRLADNGSLWQASPYWEEVRRILDVAPDSVTGSRQVAPSEAASWPELLESLATHGEQAAAHWAAEAKPNEMSAVAAAVHVLRQRSPAATPGPFEGGLNAIADEFADRFGPERAWSATRLETYRSCPFSFFVTYALGLERRAEPVEGLDAWQLGNIYHHIFERLYAAANDPGDTDALLAALPAVAGAVLDEAPRTEGFRETAWWTQTRAEIEANVKRSVAALAALPGSFVSLTQEAAFGGASALTVTGEDDSFRLRGFIDRVDRTPDGRLRIIDYKTAGPATFTVRSVAEGKKLQLPLYALAAEQALGLGRVAEGFYWHVQHAEASGFTLAGFPGGPAGAIEVALAHAWDAVRRARSGRFAPDPPDGGCPEYCPAAAFCWHYRPRRGG